MTIPAWPPSYLLTLSIVTALLLVTERGADGLVSVRRKGIRVRWPGPVTCFRCETFYTGDCRESPSKWWPCTGNYCYVLILDNSVSRYCHEKKEVEEECKANTKLAIKPGKKFAACWCNTSYCNGFPTWEPYPNQNVYSRNCGAAVRQLTLFALLFVINLTYCYSGKSCMFQRATLTIT